MKQTQPYETADGEIFHAVDYADLMRQLRLDSWNPKDSDEAYVKSTAKAAEFQTGKPHRDDSPESLVEDLIASGLIIPIKPKDYSELNVWPAK